MCVWVVCGVAARGPCWGVQVHESWVLSMAVVALEGGARWAVLTGAEDGSLGVLQVPLHRHEQPRSQVLTELGE